MIRYLDKESLLSIYITLHNQGPHMDDFSIFMGQTLDVF
jgi:hypothetical protein